MKGIFCVFILTLFATLSYGQFNGVDSSRCEAYNNRTHNFIGVVPSKARITNGWAIGLSMSIDEYKVCITPVRVNGLHTNISPLQVFVVGAGIIGGAVALFKADTYIHDTVAYDVIPKTHTLNGVSIGLFEHGDEFTMQGLQITGSVHKMLKLNGVSITTLASDYKHFNGLMISGIYNKAYLGRGLQIGLINRATKMNGVQIGVWNKIGRRGLPVMNMKFARLG